MTHNVQKKVGSENYNPTTLPCSKAIIINKKDDVITLNPVVTTYNGKPKYANNAKTLSNTKITYEYYNGSTCSGKKLTNIPENAGIYSVKVISEGNNNYNSNSICVLHTITKATPEITIKAKEYVYDGTEKQAQTLITSNIKYYSDAQCTKESNPINAGIYYGIAYFNESENYNASHSQCTKAVTIKKANDKVTLIPLSSLYTGNPISAYQATTLSNSNVIYEYFDNQDCTGTKIDISKMLEIIV